MSDSLQPNGLQHDSSPYPSSTPGIYPNSCLLSRWYHPIISSSLVPFSSCLQSFPASGSFPMSQFFATGGQCIGVSASTLVPPMNTQDWSPSGWTSWISLQSKGLSRVWLPQSSVHTLLFSPQVMSYPLWPHGLQHSRPLCSSPSPWVYPSSCPLNWWCHPTISSSVTLFFCPQSFPASGSFPMSWLFALGGQQIGASASTSVFPVSITVDFLTDWFYLFVVQGTLKSLL